MLGKWTQVAQSLHRDIFTWASIGLVNKYNNIMFALSRIFDEALHWAAGLDTDTVAGLLFDPGQKTNSEILAS